MVRAVFSLRLADPSFLTLLTDHLELPAERVVAGYRLRWTIEKDAYEIMKVTLRAIAEACGDGVIDWRRIVARLKKAGFKGVLSVECGTEEEAARSLRHLTEVLRELQA